MTRPRHARALHAARCAVIAAALPLALACSKGEQSAADSGPSEPPGGFSVSPASPPREEAAQSVALGRRKSGVGGVAGAVTDAADVSPAAGAAAVAPPPPAPSPAQAPGATTPAAPATPAMIIRTGSAMVQVDSLELAIAGVQRLVQGIAGAYVANTSIESGERQRRQATIEVKVPAAQFDRLVAGLSPLGRVEAVTVNAEDVTEEFVDVTARTENARRLEARLVDLLERRTGKLQEVLAVERELARVREEIERYEGRMRYLRTRAALSTLSVTVHERAPVLEPSVAGNPIAEALRQSWRNFVAFVAGFIALLGVLVPLAVLGYVAWWLVRRFRPRPPTPPAV